MKTHPRISWRLAKSDDIPMLLEMMETFCVLEHLRFDAALRQQLIQSIVNHEEFGRLYIVASMDQIIGYAALCFGFSFEYMGRDAFLDELFIAKEFRGQGFGKQTLDFLMTQSRQLGIRAVHLEVDLANGRAQGLYRGFGFAGTDRHLWTKWL